MEIYEFNKLLRSIKDKKAEESKKNIASYTGYINEVLKLLKEYKGPFFDRNQKFLEANNYLIAQNNSLVNVLPTIKDPDLRTLLNFLIVLVFQEIFVEFLEPV